MRHVGKELFAYLLQLLQHAIGPAALTHGIIQRCYRSSQQQDDEDRSEDDTLILALRRGINLCQLIVVQLGVSLAQRVVHLGVVYGIHHLGIVAQCNQRLTGLIGLKGFGQRLVVIANRPCIAYLLLKGDGLPDDGHSLSISLHVEKRIGHILQTNGQQVTVDDRHTLHCCHGLLGQLERLGIFAFAVVSITELREVVDHSLVVTYLAGCLYRLPTIIDGRIGDVGYAVYLAGYAQIVVGVGMIATLLVGLYGFLDEMLRFINKAQAHVDDGQIVIGTGLRLQQSIRAGQAFGFHLRIDSLGATASLVQAIASVAE